MTGGAPRDEPIETARLRLRRLVPSDASELVALDGDPEVMRFLSGGAATPASRIRHEILPRMRRPDPVLSAGGFWAVDERATDAFAGWVSLRAEEGRSGCAELGYRLRRATWGRGYAVEATAALLDAAFATDPLERVTATTYESNASSIRVMEKLGMTLVRRFRYDPGAAGAGDTHAASEGPTWDGDDVEYALDRTTWEGR